MIALADFVPFGVAFVVFCAVGVVVITVQDWWTAWRGQRYLRKYSKHGGQRARQAQPLPRYGPLDITTRMGPMP